MRCGTSGAANRVGGDLVVKGNEGPVAIESTRVGKDARITGNRSSVTVAGNTVAGNLTISSNKPPSGAPADALATTTAFHNKVGHKTECSGNSEGSSCRVSPPKGARSSLATQRSHGGSGSGAQHRQRRAKRTRHVNPHESR